MESLLLEQISKSYGPYCAADKVSLSVAKGEFVAVLGPSGGGKTTLLRIIAGLAASDTGRVLIDGADMTNVPPARRGIGLVFQRHLLFPHMNVWENIAFGLKARGKKKSVIRSEISQALESVQLSGLEKRFPHQLSGGQAQRVAIARTLVTSPNLLLLDEPLASLDPPLREEMRRFLRLLHERWGGTTILVTHDQAEAMEMADRVVVFNAGRILQDASPREVYLNPSDEFVAGFMGMRNFLHGRVSVKAGKSFLCTPAGDLPFNNLRGLKDGAEAVMAIRPEHLNETPPTSEADSANFCGFKGIVKACVFSGATQTLELSISEGLSLTILKSSSEPFEKGAELSVYASSENVRVFPRNNG